MTSFAIILWRSNFFWKLCPTKTRTCTNCTVPYCLIVLVHNASLLENDDPVRKLFLPAPLPFFFLTIYSGVWWSLKSIFIIHKFVCLFHNVNKNFPLSPLPSHLVRPRAPSALARARFRANVPFRSTVFPPPHHHVDPQCTHCTCMFCPPKIIELYIPIL